MTTRLNIVSEVALEAGQPRPIHMFRPGTFTDMNGRETSFTKDDVAVIVSRFSKRRKLPITERHDFGQAIGRLQDVWGDADGNLFGLPKWNAKGKSLLEDEIYDGFSCELDKDESGWTLIGGSLTNYPAVGGLEPVTLSAPPMPLAAQETLRQVDELAETLVRGMEETQVDVVAPAASQVLAAEFAAELDYTPAPPAPVPARADNQPPIQEHTMSDPVVEPVTLAAPTLPPINDPALQGRLDALLAQREASLEQQQRAFEARVQAEFERRLLETEQRNTIRAFAHARTMTSAEQPYAIPGTATELEQLLLETPAQVRGKWQALLTRICTAGAVSFDEIGSSGDGGADTDRWGILVNAKIATGLSRVAAIQAVAREFPDLYEAQARAKKGGR
jgi:hypothetical protein